MKKMFHEKKRLLALLSIPLLALFALSVVAPAFAYGSNDTWQITVAATGTVPSQHLGIGFWGWCALAGVSSGSNGDCVFANYVHSPSISVTCTLHVDITGWTIGSDNDFVITSGVVTSSPAATFGLCIIANSLSGDITPTSPTSGTINPGGFDIGLLAQAGHYSAPVSEIFGPGVVGEFQYNVAFIGPHS